jgi:hypothetical protein
VKPFHIRGQSLILVAGIVAAAAVISSDVPAPGRASNHRILAHVPVVSAPGPAHVSEQPPARTPSPVAHGRTRVTHAARPEANSPAASGAAGRIIALDPETGQLGAPSPEQLRALRAAPGVAEVSRSSEGLIETRLTDGTVILDLNGRFQDHVLARIDRNGRLIYDCVHGDGKPVLSPPDTAETSLEEQ